MRGILFKPDMIKAIVEGRKTVTRRLIKPQPKLDAGGYYFNFYSKNGGRIKACFDNKTAFLPSYYARYQVRELVYIKEAYSTYGYPEVPFYKDEPDLNIKSIGWHSPMTMPQKYARYFIQITDVRAERLQEITLTDIKAEGISDVKFKDIKAWYIGVWNSINKVPYDWASNPWVWVYSFDLQK